MVIENAAPPYAVASNSTPSNVVTSNSTKCNSTPSNVINPTIIAYCQTYNNKSKGSNKQTTRKIM